MATDENDPPPPYGHEVIPPLKVRCLEASILYYQKMGFDHLDTYTYQDLRIADLRYQSLGYQYVKISLHEYPRERFPGAFVPQNVKLGIATPNIHAYKYLVERLVVDVFGERFFSEHEALLYIQDPDFNQLDLYIKDLGKS